MKLLVKKRKKDQGRALDLKAGILVGTHSRCGIRIEDPLASETHVRLRSEGDAVFIADEGSALGTYIDGRRIDDEVLLLRADESGATRDVIVGATRLEVTYLDDEEAVEVVVTEQKFFFKKDSLRKKGVVRDPDSWVESEKSFGRWRTLTAASFLAFGVGLVLAPLAFVLPEGERLLNPGPLHPAHEALMLEQSCEMCHRPGVGTPVDSCATAGCHQALAEPSRHPFVGAAAAPAHWPEGHDCADCHREHLGGKITMPDPAERCDRCHAADEVRPATLGDLVERGGWRHARSASELPSFSVPLEYDAFSHRSHLAIEGMECSTCHQIGPEREGREFPRIGFAQCMGCHDAREPGTAGSLRTAAADAFPIAAEHRYATRWHGNEEQATCAHCHVETAPADEPARGRFGAALLASVVLDGHLEFELERRPHDFHTPVEGRACTECHVDAVGHEDGQGFASSEGLSTATTFRALFWHGLHLSDLAGGGSDRECRTCHVEQETALALAGGPERTFYGGPPPESCEECHYREQGATRVPTLGREPTLQPATGEARTRTGFPHRFHLDVAADELPPGAGLTGEGCFLCHEFPAREDPLQAVPLTKPSARDCTTCHANHANVGKPLDLAKASRGDCGACHGFEVRWADPDASRPEDRWRFSAWRGEGRPKPRATSAEGSGFQHQSVGHADLVENGQCSDCHPGTEQAETIFDVRVVSQAEASCRQCHVAEKRRFHWQ